MVCWGREHLIQHAIDRRFYRKKYNAQQVLARFAQTARWSPDGTQLVFNGVEQR